MFILRPTVRTYIHGDRQMCTYVCMFVRAYEYLCILRICTKLIIITFWLDLLISHIFPLMSKIGSYTVKTVVWISYCCSMYFIPNHVIPVKIGGMKYFRMHNIPYFGDRVCMSYQCNKRLRNILI